MDTPTHSVQDNTLSIINHPASRLSGPSLLHHLVQVNSSDNAPAIDFLAADGTRSSLSYTQFHHEVELLAARISTLAGAQPSDEPFVVPVLIPQGPQLYVALLAILKAGGAFCPLNLDVPLERAKFILDDVSAKVIITTSELASKTPKSEGRAVLIIDAASQEEPQESPDIRHKQPQPSDLAYIMYTSGSTGTPKGVGVSHEAATQSLLAHDRYIPAFSRFLQFAAPTFDVSVFEIFFPFFRGKTLVSCARPAMLNDLPGVLRLMDVDACELTPTVAGSLLRNRENAPNLRLLLTIGEMLTKPVIEEFGGSDDRLSMLWAMYGPTEAAIHCTLQPAFACDSLIGNIGIPLDSVSAFIVEVEKDAKNPGSESLRILPRGEIGELAVGGYQTAQGYLNRPEQTAEAFVDSPFGRLYLTKDKARIHPDGTLECLGRISDGQVKLRGQRIELGEIEHAALRAPGCHSAFAAVINNILVLFCAVDEMSDTITAINKACEEWLPGFMVPGDVVVMREFPRLASGKVDRKGLIADYSHSGQRKPVESVFTDDLERQLCDIASQVLGAPVNPSENLSRIGMDSLAAIKFASALRKTGLDVGVVDILASRTISALHARVPRKGAISPEPLPSSADLERELLGAVCDSPYLRNRLQEIDTVIPCTPLQVSMLAETMADPRAYCNWIELNFPADLAETMIRSSFSRLAQENEALRSGFVQDKGKFLQVIFKELDHSEIQLSDDPVKQFEMHQGEDFLRPFRVQIAKPDQDSDTAVVIQLHHAAYDGWSLDMMLSDLETLVRGEQPKARPQFREVSAYYRSASFMTGCNASREFWAEHLSGFQPAALPSLWPKAVPTPATLSMSFPLPLNPDTVRTTLQEIDAAPQTVFQAALAWIWSSLMGSEDVVLGTVTSGRTLPILRIEDIFGPCIASLPTRTNLAQVKTIKDLLASIHAANRAILPHSILPLAEIKRAAGIRAGQSVYDVLFVYQESLQSKACVAKTIQEINHRDYLETKLLVEVEPTQDSFVCRLTFHADVFPEAEIAVLGQAIQTLVPFMLENMTSELSAIPTVFSPQLLSVYNEHPASFSGVPDLALAVEAVAAKFPERDALCFAGEISEGMVTTTSVSFDGLSKTANRIAWHLKQSGVREGDAVAIVMEKSVLLYAGILAILKVGCAYLPLLPNTPLARVENIFGQAGVTHCLTDTAAQGTFESLACSSVNLQSIDLRDYPDANPSITPDPSRVSYIIFTSGSTGTPKGVCVTQLNIMSNLDVLSRIYPTGENSRMLQSCSQAFDVSVFEIFFAWTQGMCLCSGTNDTLFEDLERSIRKLNVTHLSMTPTVASLVDPIKVPKVEFLVTAGEAMTEVVARKWAKQLYQGYGPSETTNICSVKKMGEGQIIQHLGWSFENTSTFVLYQGSLDIVPLGCFGEFCFGGDQVAQGYLNMPELTSAKFIDHPQYGRLYRSGDLGRMLPDGSMVIFGRVDEQIKIRGQRVELTEITSTIRELNSVIDCATLFLKQKDSPTAGQIVAFVVLRSGEGTHFHALEIEKVLGLIQSLFRLLTSRVPGYMVPSFIIPISVLPTTASGKLDRARLGDVVKNLREQQLSHASPAVDADQDDGQWSDAERLMAEIVAKVFGVVKSGVGRWAPLSTLGLDSISAIELSKQIRNVFGRRLAISTILQNASVARLAQAIPATSSVISKRTVELLSSDVREGIVKKFADCGGKVEKILPCTPLQEAMLAVSAGRGSYLNRMLLRVNGDVSQLKGSWEAACERHGILRTCFVTTEEAQQPIAQVVLGDWQPPWHEFDASDAGIDECISKHVDTLPGAIDSLKPAISFAVINQHNAAYLSFVCHHALYDGVAIERLLFEVEQILSGSPLPSPPAYDEFLRESLSLPESTDSFWLQHLSGFKPSSMKQFKIERPARSSFTITKTELSLSLISGKAQQLGVSLLSLTQAAWAAVLATLFRTNDICFGNVVNGRTLPIERIDELVAPCFNTIPVRMDLSDKQRNVDLMKAFQSLTPNLIHHQFTPLRRVQSLASRSGSRRLFDTLLLFQQPSRELDESVWILERDDGEMDVPVVCEVIPDTHDDLLVAKLHVEPHRLSNEVAELILDLFSHVLNSCVQFPASDISLFGSIPAEFGERLARIPFEVSSDIDSNPQPVDTADEVWTTAESNIRDVLSTLSTSDVARIRRQTTIYQLGLDSISAVQIASQLRKKGYHVLASDVIDNPTYEKLARHLESRVLAANRTKATFDINGFRAQVWPQIMAQGVTADSAESILPCTPLQSGMLAQFIKSSGQDYFNFLDFRVDDNVDISKLALAWEAICTTYQILRTGFTPVENDACAFAMIQYVPGAFAPPLTAVSRGHTGFHLDKWRLDAAYETIENLERSPWRVTMVETDDGLMMHLAIHHALYDAQSLQLLLDDLASAVRGDASSTPPATEDAVVDILDTTSDQTDSSEAFWRTQAERVVINGFPVMTPLREATRSILVESATSALSFSALEASISKSGYTLQVVLQAAWTRILSSYLGESSVVFGVVLSGRTTEATQSAMLPCITTLPVVSMNAASNRELLDQMLSYNADLYKQQHQPLTRIQQWLGRPDVRLFETLLVYQKFNVETSKPRPWTIVNDQATVDYPVSVEVEPQAGDTLKHQITFFNDIVPVEQAQLLLRQFDAMVCQLALSPDGNESGLLESSPELFSVLPVEQPELPAPVRVLHQFVESQALTTPEKTALHFVHRFDGDIPIGRQWTYRELDDNGNRAANAILPHVKVGDIVAIDFDKCAEAFFSILGILKAGCAFVALDPGAPAARKEFIIRDSEAAVLLTSQEGSELGYSVLIPVIRIDEDLLAAQSSDPPITDRAVDPADVCYCLYTSGTTGTPKGCEITHDNAVQCMLAFQHIFKGHWEEDSRWLQFASLHFDVSVLEQYWSWSVGITLVASPRDLILEDLAGTISRLGITHIDLTPSLARLVHPDDVPSLCRGVFITGGESLKQEILDVWGDKAVIYNFYGPTEVTIGVTVYPRVPQNGRASNIGKQFINVGSYVLRPGTDIPVLRGAVGELCVSGKLVGKGYLRRDDLTAERFPTLEKFGERVYRTGDLIRVLHDNCFDFLGRVDDQVKLRGQRLEIGEINHAIKTGVDEIEDVATLVVRNEKQQKDFLVSFIVGEKGEKRRTAGQLQVSQTTKASDLCRQARNACRSRLPSYMVPTYAFQLPYIPLSPNHKAEIKELRALFNSLSQDQLVSLSTPTEASPKAVTDTQKKVVSALAAMLSVDGASVTSSSSIFELGIDSISVLRLSRSLKKDGLPQASPSLILSHPLIGDLVHALEVQRSFSRNASVAAARQVVQACAHRHRSYVCGELGVTPDQIEYIAPCSPLQQGMISKSTAYLNTFRFRLADGVSSALLRRAWGRAVDALPILRTLFVGTADGFVQVALKALDLPWSESDTDDWQEVNERWLAQNQDNLTRPWEILLSGGAGERVMTIHIFHGLYDANSLGLLISKVVFEYLAIEGSLANGDSHQTYGPSFLDALCHGPLQNFNDSKQFWVDHFRDASPITNRALHDNKSVASHEREISFKFFDELTVSLSVTHQTIVQAAWAFVLAKQLSVDPTFGVITSGRAIDLDGVDAVVGPLFNTLPFHVSIRDDVEVMWSSLIRKCHDFNTAILAFQHVPLRDIQKWCSGGRSLFDTLFSFQREDLIVLGRQLWTEIPYDPTADYPLALEATLLPDGHLRLLIVAQVADSDQLRSMADELEAALVAMQNPDEPIWPGQDRRLADITHTKLNGTPNGVSADPVAKTDFTWTEDAITIRNEMSLLSGVSPETIAGTTSVFELGLDSIDIIKLSARLKQHGIKIKTSLLMKAQTIEAIVALVRDQLSNSHSTTNGDSRTDRNPDILREHAANLGHDLQGVETVLPATPMQDAMVAEMLHSEFQLYFNHDVIALSPDVDIERLQDAWKTVIAASPILRTAFLPVEDQALDFAYFQVVENKPSCYVAKVELDSKIELAKVLDASTQRARKAGGRSDLLQLVFADVAGDRFLALSIAHALYDGWSLGLIHQDVQAAYYGQYSPRPSYELYLVDIVSASNQESSRFWAGFLDGAGATILPEKQPVQKDAIYRTETNSSISMSEVTSFCKHQAITQQVLGQACWAALLASKTQSLDVTFGVVVSGRDSELAESLMFPTMNTVAVRSVLHGTIASWLRYMQDNMTNIASFQHFPLRQAQKLVKGATGPLFNTLFIHQRPLATTEGENALGKSIDGFSSVEYPVCIEMEASEGALVWRVACDENYVSRQETATLLHQLEVVLGYFVGHAEADVLRFSDQQIFICGLSAMMPKTQLTAAAGKRVESWPPQAEKIRSVLALISGVPEKSIAATDTIYHLGLDSISATKASSLMRKQGIPIGFRDMLKAKSISEMARLVTERQLLQEPSAAETAETDGLPTVLGKIDVSRILADAGFEPTLFEEVLPATAMQVHMLSVWQNTHGQVFYPDFRFRMTGSVDAVTISSAWERLVDEIPVLRTVFVSTTLREVPMLQAVLRPSRLNYHAASPESEAWDSSSTSQSYSSLSAKHAEGNWILQMRIHHALYDAVSLPIILDRFADLCAGKIDTGSSSEIRSSWTRFVGSRLPSPATTARMLFWTGYLSGVEQTLSQGHEQAPHDTRVSLLEQPAIADISSIRAACAKNGVSIQALFFAAYATLLAKTQTPGSRDVVFGIYLANRGEVEESHKLPYPTLCLVPLRVRVGGGASLVSVAAQVQGDLYAISSPANVAVGLWEIMDWTGVTVRSFVNFLSLPERAEEAREVRMEEVEVEEVEVEHAQPWLEGNIVRDTYPDAVDVEVSIQGEAMTIGVFGPGGTLEEHGARDTVSGIVELLGGV
ncbi:non-ribosomal peptide synthetase [Lasiosphaeria hispida]|uniref:Non-ribosomal peptide synthetase n=1 Tax=Lasiosphaeria hispida TaxID=260671 RepID=A0AAJ0MD41_9PEZI|nr:non-ribosomal peptide synthetase [Lasiosphaeria hispida]